MQFEDLTPHEYRGVTFEALRRVGWCNASGFPKGPVDERLVRALRVLRDPLAANIGRGFEPCGISGELVYDEPGGGHRLGQAELWVPAEAGAGWFCAPDRIIHYVGVHGYSPPEPFVRAVLALTERRADELPDLEQVEQTLQQTAP
ncbi:MAG: hypothetical protein KTR31_16115, partial [Myxococcales bacterium]|nr:hypothetical protein [Myxococcales bacterium]